MRLKEISQNSEAEMLVEQLMDELDCRFEQMSRPCVEAIGKKVELKLIENLQAFRQIPAYIKMDQSV